MPGRPTRMLATLLGLVGCAAASDPGDGLAAIGAETKAPPMAERAAIEQAVAQWADGRFTPAAPRWFVLKPGAPAVAAMKAVDNSLGKSATRITETGPDGAAATLYGWRLKQGGGVVAAVSRSDPAVVGYYAVTFKSGWPD